jgi:hypothetical protein
MRNSITVFLALVTVGFLSGGAWAGTIKLKGTFTSGQIDIACINNNGTPTAGTGPGGFGCKTDKGEVSCTSAGKCTGTCQACGARLVGGGGKSILTSVLTSSVKQRRAIVRAKG